MVPNQYNTLPIGRNAANANMSVVPTPQITANGLQMGNANFSPVGGYNPMSQFESVPINVMDSIGPMPGGGQDFSTMQRWFGGTNEAGASTMGYAPAALGIGQFGLNAYMGLKNYGLAKKQLSLAKDSFNFNKDLSLTNLENQANLTNAELADRQNKRNIQNPGMFEDTASYMANYGVKGNV
ncbi:hypothetical protein [Marinobacter shengliensis]|uniref:hypothetical protein n=1 Tax=Marinobacter shengliensis TaxID=1389223 RepID=UPI001E2BC0CE|nr:hypothetical protein [Marinobacter shengliensis]MCD1628466.1 hypothetical protein [Marinobacter shengliensis]